MRTLPDRNMMSCPVHKLRPRTGPGVGRRRGARRVERFTRLIGRSPVTTLTFLLISAGVVWYYSSHDNIDALQSLLAAAAITIFLLICIAFNTQRLNKSTVKAELLSGEIKHNDALYRAVVDTAADAIILADQRGTVLSFNRAAEQIFGYSENEAIGQNVKILMPEDQCQAHDGHMRRYVETKVSHVLGVGRVVEGRRKDGTLFPLHLSIAEWSDGADEIGYTAILRDITLQQQVQQALIESESQIRLIMDCATDYAIYQIDLDDRMVKWNKGTERILGYSADELRDFDINRLFPRDETGELDKGQPTAPIDLERHETEGWRVRKDGSRFWASGVVQPILDGAAKVIGMAVVLQDRTKQRDNDETLRLAKEQAEAAAFVESNLRGEIEAANIDLVSANRGLQQFTSIVAHDLRAPLKRIDAFMTALREDYTDRLDDEGKEMMTRVSRGAARMELMLDSLLDYSRYNADAIGGKSADLVHVVKGVIESCDFETVESKININVADAPRVKGDPLLLAHVFQNLIGNSIKFRRGERVCIDIEAIASGDVVLMSVTDNGIGIEPRFADKVFDMFARLHDEDEYEGSGIGLTVCRKIVTDHGGRIWIDPDYDAGTRIYVTLQPAAGERQDEPDLIMQLYQSMQRRPLSAPGIDPDAIPAHLQHGTSAHPNHHAQFNRKAR